MIIAPFWVSISDSSVLRYSTQLLICTSSFKPSEIRYGNIYSLYIPGYRSRPYNTNSFQLRPVCHFSLVVSRSSFNFRDKSVCLVFGKYFTTVYEAVNIVSYWNQSIIDIAKTRILLWRPTLKSWSVWLGRAYSSWLTVLFALWTSFEIITCHNCGRFVYSLQQR